MSEQAYFSPSRLVFIPAEWKEDGTYTADNWPADAVLLTAEQTATYWNVTPPSGKQLTSAGGLPVWGYIPALTQEQLKLIAENERARLRQMAEREIEWRQDAVDADIATEDEITALAAWKKYRVLLMRVDTAAPVWPTVPVV